MIDKPRMNTNAALRCLFVKKSVYSVYLPFSLLSFRKLLFESSLSAHASLWGRHSCLPCAGRNACATFAAPAGKQSQLTCRKQVYPAMQELIKNVLFAEGKRRRSFYRTSFSESFFPERKCFSMI